MRVLVCGGRDFGDLSVAKHLAHGTPLKMQRYNEHTFIWRTLDEMFPVNKHDPMRHHELRFILGGARGVDTAAHGWAVNNWIHADIYPAEWDKYGKRAGYIRNQQMLDEGKPDLVVAFPGGRGTAMMVDIARKAGVEVREVKYDSGTREHHSTAGNEDSQQRS